MPTISPFGLDGSNNTKSLSPFDIKGKGLTKIFSPCDIHYAAHEQKKDLGPALHPKSFIIYDLHDKHQHLNLQYHSFDQPTGRIISIITKNF